MVPKNSPCTRPTASQSSAWARKMRVRTTSSKVAPASASAAAAISKMRRVWAAGVQIVCADRAGSGEVNGVADANGAREADDRLVGRGAGNVFASHIDYFTFALQLEQ